MKIAYGILKLFIGLLLIIGSISMIINIPESGNQNDIIKWITKILFSFLYIYSIINNGIIELNKKRKHVFFGISEILFNFLFAFIFILSVIINSVDSGDKIPMIFVACILTTMGIKDSIQIYRKT